MALQGPTASYWTNPANETGRNAPIPINDDKQENVPRPELARRMEAAGIKGGVTPENLKKYCQYLADKGDHVVTLGSGPNASRFAPASWGNSAATSAKKGDTATDNTPSSVVEQGSAPVTSQGQGAVPTDIAGQVRADIQRALEARNAGTVGSQMPTMPESAPDSRPVEAPINLNVDIRGGLAADIAKLRAEQKTGTPEGGTKSTSGNVDTGTILPRTKGKPAPTTLDWSGYEPNRRKDGTLDGTHNFWRPIKKPKKPTPTLRAETPVQSAPKKSWLGKLWSNIKPGGKKYDLRTGEEKTQVPFGSVLTGWATRGQNNNSGNG